MGLLGILLTVALIAFVVYAIWYVFLKKAKLLSNCRSGTKQLVISPKKLHGNSNTNNYAYSIWFYVTDWSYRLSETKDLLIRGGAGGTANPRITLAPYENNLSISVHTFPTHGGQQPLGPGGEQHGPLGPGGLPPGAHPLGPPPAQAPTCTVNNFPLQRWVNLIVSLNNRTMDVYLDGKLVRTCILPAPAKIDPDAPVILTPGGGFKGWTSNTQYFATPLNPQEAFNIYAAGPKCGGMSLFDKYKLRITYLVNNQPEAQVTL
jgi:hypothetical protein